MGSWYTACFVKYCLIRVSWWWPTETCRNFLCVVWQTFKKELGAFCWLTVELITHNAPSEQHKNMQFLVRQYFWNTQNAVNPPQSAPQIWYHPHLATTRVCEQKLPAVILFTATLNTRHKFRCTKCGWRYIAVWLQHSNRAKIVRLAVWCAKIKKPLGARLVKLGRGIN